MPPQMARGPSRFLVTVFLIGVGLLFWAVFVPTVHSVWQVVLGAVLSVVSVGRMVAR
jgi:hypothetical protein